MRFPSYILPHPKHETKSEDTWQLYMCAVRLPSHYITLNMKRPHPKHETESEATRQRFICAVRLPSYILTHPKHETESEAKLVTQQVVLLPSDHEGTSRQVFSGRS